ncbi:MAG TPA: hypothetical protein VFP77_02570, partial [Gemmatimonadaceae bacterium]|nr:hypothetical protein [Gemmatimonadaceae bacterium]
MNLGRVRIVAFEVENVPNVRLAPAVDRLIRITDDADVVMLGCQRAHEEILHAVGVLIFVDQHVAKPVLIALECVGDLFEESQRLAEQIVKIERAIPPKRFLVDRVDPCDDLFPVAL